MDLSRFRPQLDGPSTLGSKFADLKLKYLDDKQLIIHKVLLAARMDEDAIESLLGDSPEIELVKVDNVTDQDYNDGITVLLDFLYSSSALACGTLALLVAWRVAEQLHLSELKTLVDAAMIRGVQSSMSAALAVLTRDDQVSVDVEAMAVQKIADSLLDRSATSETLEKLSIDRVAKVLKLVSSGDAMCVYESAKDAINKRVPSCKVKVSVSSLVPSGKPWGEKPEMGWNLELLIDDTRRFSLPPVSSFSSLTGEEGVSVDTELKEGFDCAELLLGRGRWRFESLKVGLNSAANSLAKIVLNITRQAESPAAEAETAVNIEECFELGDLIQWDKLDTEVLRQAGHMNMWKAYTSVIVDTLAMRNHSSPPPAPVDFKPASVEAAVVKPAAAPLVSEVSADRKNRKSRLMEYRGGGWRDQNGLLFQLGTEHGNRLYRNPSGQTVRVISSSSGYGLMETISGRARTTFRTKNEDDAYVGIHLMNELAMDVRGYFIRTADEPGRRLLTWEAEVSMDGVAWETVDVRKEETTLAISGEGFFETQVEKRNQKYFRIRQTAKNSSGGFNLVLANIEIYGILSELGVENSVGTHA